MSKGFPRRAHIEAVLFDRVRGRSWTWVLPDPPPQVLMLPRFDARTRHKVSADMEISEQLVIEEFGRLYFELLALDDKPRVVYISKRGRQGDVNERFMD